MICRVLFDVGSFLVAKDTMYDDLDSEYLI